MEKDFFVGIDGGGSKTHLRLETSDGKVLAESFSGPSPGTSRTEAPE